MDKIFTSNFQRTDSKSNTETDPGDERHLMVLYGMSAVGGFTALKLLSMML